ncbi:MAG: phosphopantetheine-binding protein [Rhodobacter sp.]|nr:phosphopantetheine-binding protein [Rhodobacter sp.]MCY4168602.1 phosphopantetheine-binding protein [Rhodobacter sp.]MCY4240950.1 phosphopantetheine-binding protein [Rhodobacter sp.]
MSVRERVIKIIAVQAMLETEDVSGENSLEELGIDSLGLVESIFAIEEEFGIEVPFNANEPDSGEFDITSVDAIARAVEAILAERRE